MPTRRTPSSHRNSTAHRREQRRAVEEHERALRTRSPEARAKRKQRTPIWKRLRLVALVLLLIGLGQLVTAALTSPEFRVADVTVSGAEMTDADKIAEAQQALIGQNWIRLRSDDTVKALRTLPTVKSARITRALHWPPHLHLAIEEREPFVRVGGGDEWWVVDESGVPFRPAQKSIEDEKLFAITNPKFEPIAGKPLAKEEWEPAFQLASTLSAQKTAWPLRRIYFDKNGFASLRLQGGRHDEMLIRLGGDRWPEKLDRARLALEYFDRTNQRAKTLNLVSYIMPQWTPVRPVQAALDPSGTRATPGA